MAQGCLLVTIASYYDAGSNKHCKMGYRRRRRYYAPRKTGRRRWGGPSNWVGMVLILIGLPLIPVLLGVPIFLLGLVLALAGLN